MAGDPKSTSSPSVQLQLKRLSLHEYVAREPLLLTSLLLRSLPEKTRTELLGKGVPRRAASGTPLFRKGDMVGPLYMVLRGEVHLSDERGVEVARAVQGEFCGESELVRPSPARRQTALASGETDYAEFAADYVAMLLKQLPALRALLGQVDAERSKAQSELDDFLNRW
jgi:CRP-like cAMP-binding protein